VRPLKGTALALTRLAALALALAFPQVAAAGTALVYDGPGLCDGCAEAAAAAVRLAGLDVVMAGPEALEPDRLQRFDLVVVGGAEATLDIRRGMTKAQFRALRNYVRDGGRYLGLCAGAYLAGAVLDDAGRVPGLRLFDGDAYPASPYAARVEPVTWNGRVVALYTQEAAGFELGSGFDGEIVATYADGSPAAVLARSGAGAIGLSGPHPEATADWLKADGLPPAPLPGPALAAEFIAALMALR